ncbi:MAG: hypothetical protein UT37_C0017G0004 [Parcubacteria group bacterium GW2011_GWA2_39_18]|nr:MAG: hypothetical protein UT37_C0017G0004 [Parcubacteria group bacterium GW2011_GWA2_39_18]
MKEKPLEEKGPSSPNRYEMQKRLIEEFCKIKGMNDAGHRNTCAMDWIAKYADNFDQLDKELIEKYKNAQNEQERASILDEIQKALEILDQKNG